MKCPHCKIAFHETHETYTLGGDCDYEWQVHKAECPECHKFVISLYRINSAGSRVDIVYPENAVRDFAPSDVPEEFAKDFNEAVLVFPKSAKASANLSRPCLQNLLREKAGVKHSTLNNEIEEVLDSNTLPSHLAEAIDGIRAVGNFGSHPIKSTSTGQVVDVEPGEAEWLLDTLEGLFAFYFVQPKLTQMRRDDLNRKLVDAGKPQLK